MKKALKGIINRAFQASSTPDPISGLKFEVHFLQIIQIDR